MSSASATTYYWNRNSVLVNDRDFAKSYNWTSNANGTGTYAPSAQDDAFTSTTLGSSWTYRAKDSSNGNGTASSGYSLTANSGQLTLTGRGADVWLTNNQWVAITRDDIYGNFDVTLKVASQSNTDPYAKAGLFVANDATNLTDGGYFLVAMTPSHGVVFDYDQSGTVGELDAGVETASLGYPVWIRMVKYGFQVSAFYKTAVGNAWTQVGSAQTGQGSRLRQSVGIFSCSHNTGSTGTTVFDDFSGGGTISTTGLDLSLAGSGGNQNASATLGSNDLSANSLDMTGYTGTLNFGGQNGLFATAYTNGDLTGTSASRVDTTVDYNFGAGSPDPGVASTDNWTLTWAGYVVPQYSETYTFYTNSDDGCRLWVNNQLLVDKYVGQGVTEWSGTIALTAGQRYPIYISYMDQTASAEMHLKWSSSSQTKEVVPKRALFAGKLSITGTGTALNMGSNATITAGDGSIDFASGSGTQSFVPRSGQTMPKILHSGAGTLQLMTNALTTLGFYQSAGTFDFNSLNVTVSASGNNNGDFSVVNGTTSSFTNLGGRTVTVAGNASFVGQSGNLIDLNPGSAWTLAVTGQLNANYATITNCNASVSSGVAYKSASGGSNSGWSVYGSTFYWDRNAVITSSTDFSKAYNWAYNADGTGFRPTSTLDDYFDANTLGSWTFRDVDNNEASGSYSISGGALTIGARGADIYGSTNEYAGMTRSDITGDYFDIQVKMLSQSNTDVWAKAGILVANNFANLASGGYAFMAVTPGNGWSFQYNTTGTIGQIVNNSSTGSVTFPCWLRMIRNGTGLTAYYKTSLTGSWIQVGGSVTPLGFANGTSSQIGLFVCSKSGSTTGTATFDNFQAGVNMNSTDNDLSFNGTGGNADANATLSTNQTATSIDFTNYSGTFNFGSSTLTISGGNATFTSTMGLTAGTGTLAFDAGFGINSTFIPKSGATFPPIVKSNANGVAMSTNALITPSFTMTGGSCAWPNGITNQVGSLTASGGSWMIFNSGTVNVTSGNADLGSLGTVTANTGTLAFTGTSGTQVFTPKSGQTHPNITHTGASTLQLSTNSLSCLSFSQSAGILDFNSRDVTTTSAGNFTITNGNSSSVTNLAARTLTVAGNASFTGTAGSLLNLDRTSTWTINATGTLTASYANIGYSDASGSASTGVATNCTSSGGNLNWNFNALDYSAWNYSTQINFNTTSTGTNTTSNLVSFPLLVRLDSNNFLFPQAMPDGRDLRFVDPDGSALSYEIERWDITLKKAEIWVRVPQIDGNSNRDYIKMYWGNSAATAWTNTSPVFAGYTAAFHFQQSPGGSAPQFADVSGSGNDGTAQNGAAGDSLTSVIGLGYKLNGSSKYVSTANSFTNLNTFTAGCWFKTNTTSGGKIFGNGSAQTGTSFQYDRHVWMDNTGKLSFGVNPSTTKVITSTSAYNDGAWHLVVGRLGPSGQFLYVDGAQVASDPTVTTAEPHTGYWRFGFDNMTGWSPSPTSSYFNGTLDEGFTRSSELSADWIKFAYQNQRPYNTSLVFTSTALSTWSYSSKIYVNTTATGANTTADVANFPMLVRLTAANFNFSQAKSNGADLRFADSTGALLPYEIERFDATNKAADIWVLLGNVKANNNSQWFQMYWGKPTATSLSSGSSVFTSSNGFLGVWHLGEDGNTTAGGYADASSRGNNGTGTAMTNASDVSAVAGYGQSFNGSTQYLNLGGGATGSSLHATTALTLELWTKSTAKAVYSKLISKSNPTAASPWTEFEIDYDSPATRYRFDLTTGGSLTVLNSVTNPSDGSWYHLTATYDGSNMKFYVNGVLESSTAKSGTIDDLAQAVYLSYYSAGSNSFYNGTEDEVRVSGAARSGDWAKLSYETQKSGSTVVKVGARSFDFTNSVRFNFNTTATGANVTGTDVTNIPILVRLTSSNFDFSKTTATGTDIQFIDKDGTYLYHEVVEWDKGNSTGKVWVKVPQVDKNSTTDYITLYYGCSTCTASPYAVSDSVFSGFNGVWHLSGDATTGADATKYKNAAAFQQDQPTTTGLTTPLARYYGGTTTDYGNVPNPGGGELDFGVGDFTIGAWIKTSNTSTAVYPMVISKEAGGRTGYSLLFDNGNPGQAKFEIWSSNTQASKAGSSTALNDGNWHYVVGKKTSTAIELFVDGVSNGTTAHSVGSVTNANPLNFGRNPNITSNRFTGYIDEAQVSATALSADFIKLSYENQKATSTLFSSTTITTASFQHSKVFKFNTTASGANIAGDVYNFPVLIRLTGATVINATQANAPDIRFLDGDGVTWLDYEIERWNQSVDSAEVWVKVPKVEGNSSGDFITLYYQQAAGVTVPDGQCASCVFGTDNNYVGVWHLNTSGTGARPNAVSGGNSLTTSGYEGDEYMMGNIANSDNLEGTNDYLNMGSGYADFTTGFTYSLWAYPTSNANWSRFCDIGNGQAADNINFARVGGTSDLTFENYNNATSGGQITATGALTNNTWQHFVVTFDPQLNVKIYKNGALVKSGVSTNAIRNITRTSAFIGKSNWGADAYYAGRIDEPEISKVVRDSNWIKLAYQNERTDAAPLFNPSTADFQKSKKFTFNTTKTGANVMDSVTNFPMLVRFTDADGGLLSLVQSGAPDIRFLDGDGKTWLNYQVERWSTTTSPDSAEIWVNVPQVDGNSDHDFITLYYQQAAGVTVADGQCATCVFSSSATGVVADYHLATTVTDATGTYNGTDNSTADVGGIIGRGRSFNGSTQYISINRPVQDDFTIGLWINTSQTGGTGSLWLHGNGLVDGEVAGVTNDFGVSLYGSNASMGTGNPDQLVTSADVVNGGTWQYITATRNRTTGALALYVNGSQKSTGTGNTSSLTAPANLDFGRIHTNLRYFSGNMDEIQISNVVRDSNWIRLAYQDQRNTGNVLFGTRVGPDNIATLTATAGIGNITLSWNSGVSDSANADSVGLWVKYTGYPDSANAASTTRVVQLAKADTTYNYPAVYPGTYYFALAVRNSNGKWSPFTKASSDTANLAANAFLTDTVYVDSAIGSDANSCTLARSPLTPKLTIINAASCESNNVNDTLVVRVLPGTYTDNNLDPNVKPIVVMSFDNNSRAVLNGSGSLFDGATRNFTVCLRNDLTLRNMDVKCATNNNIGVYIASPDANSKVEGCRIYNNGSAKHDVGIEFLGNSNNYIRINNNAIIQPTTYGLYITADNSYNVINNVFYGTGTAGTKGLYMNATAASPDMTISNNIFDNWDYGIQTNSASVGVCSNNLFYLVTSGREVTGTSDANKILKDPLFANTTVGNPNAFKLLPGSPAIDAGTATMASGAQPVTLATPYDAFGSVRPQGTAPDIGLYEGTGYTSNPAGEFDTLTTTSTATTVTVYNSKWKIVFDKAKGGGISEFYDQSAPATNLLAAGTVLFDAKVDALTASSQSTIAPTIIEQCASRVVVWQRYGASGNLDVNLYYTIHPSGHIYIQSQLVNLSSSTLTVGTVDYTAKVNSATAAFTTAAKDGFGYLTTTTRDVAIVATQALDNGSSAGSETWTGSATSGASGKVVFNTTDLLDIAKNFRRNHHFLLYIGDASLTYDKAAALKSDAGNPSPLTTSAGGLIHERSWQDALLGHWTFDEGAGSIVRDKSITNTNNGTITGAKFTAGKVNSGLTFANTDVVVINDDNALEASNSRTFMFWVKPNWASSGSTAYVISKGQSTSDGWYFRRNSGASTLEFRVAGTTISTPVLTTGVWSHIAGTIGNTDKVLRLYVNGVLEAASTSACTPTANASNLRFGENTGGGAADKYVGDLDDVRIYNTDLDISDIQSVYNQGFSQRYGHYRLRADNNNRLVALINGGAAATRIQPSFQIDNWFGPATPKYVYLNGVRLKPLTDFSSSILQAYNPEVNSGIYGYHLILQLNKVLTAADQTLFIDDDDSTGYMGTASQMKALSITTTANNKIAIRNFADTVFSGATSGQWALEVGLNGWTTPGTNSVVDSGFGNINSWKAAAISPNVAISSATQQVGIGIGGGRGLARMKFQTAGPNSIQDGGAGYSGPANIGYTWSDSSATRISFTLSTMTLTGTPTISLVKRWTIYPTGRIFGSYSLTTTSNLDDVRLDFQGRYDNNTPIAVWSNTTAAARARHGRYQGDLNFHSFVGGLLSIKSNNVTDTTAAGMVASGVTGATNSGGEDYKRSALQLQTGLFQAADGTITVNFAMDISKNFTDSATADSLIKDVQTPAVLTAITGARVTNDALDFNGDNFAEGDGAYTYAAAGTGVAHFKFANTVTSFNPAFRISSWTFGTLPEYVVVDNQILTKGYHYNAFLNTATNEVVLQLNLTLAPGTHVIYISHKAGLAVKLRSFEAKDGEGVDTLEWSTESEFENLGYHLYRRVASAGDQLDTALAVGNKVGGAGIANAILDAARAQVMAKASAKLAKAMALLAKSKADSTGSVVPAEDTLPSMNLTAEELAALGYERITPNLIHGAPGGASATTQNYRFIDRTAAFGIAYEYLLESVDFQGSREQFGPKIAKPTNPFYTELYPNYPNPFNPITTLHFSLKEKAKVSLVIYDGKGRVVRTLLRPDKPMAPGKYRLIWDAKNESGMGVPSGQYFYRLTAPHYNKTRKMILVK